MMGKPCAVAAAWFRHGLDDVSALVRGIVSAVLFGETWGSSGSLELRPITGRNTLHRHTRCAFFIV
jgi:hypothetical protein